MAMSDSYSRGKTPTALQVVTFLHLHSLKCARLFVNTYSPVPADCGQGSGPPAQRSLCTLQTHKKRYAHQIIYHKYRSRVSDICRQLTPQSLGQLNIFSH